jgi:hypothetical protein
MNCWNRSLLVIALVGLFVGFFDLQSDARASPGYYDDRYVSTGNFWLSEQQIHPPTFVFQFGGHSSQGWHGYYGRSQHSSFWGRGLGHDGHGYAVSGFAHHGGHRRGSGHW